MTPRILYELLFSSCACVADECKSHFIRRTAGNQQALAHVLLPQHIEVLRDFIVEELFHLQEINEDKLHYFVLWERTEWDHSNERRALIRKEYQQNDIAFILKTAQDIRLNKIIEALVATKIFNRDKALAYAKSLTSGTEETYAAKALNLVRALTPLIDTKLTIYFPLSESIKQIDHRHVVPEETIRSLAQAESNFGANNPQPHEAAGRSGESVSAPRPQEGSAADQASAASSQSAEAG